MTIGTHALFAGAVTFILAHEFGIGRHAIRALRSRRLHATGPQEDCEKRAREFHWTLRNWQCKETAVISASISFM